MLVEWDIPFPMLSLGSVFGNFAPVIQWYSITGVFGGTLWILLVNFLFLELFKNRKITVPLPLILVIPIIISCIMYFNRREESGKNMSVIVVNNNLENNNHFNKTIDLLYKDKDDNVKLIVCPEGLFDISDRSFQTNRYFSTIKRLLKSNYNRAEMIIGCEFKSVKKRLHNKTSYYNLAVQFNSNGRIAIRNKKILVPFGEFIPYDNYLGKIDRIKKAVGKVISYRPEYDTVFTCNEFKVLPLICYELYFGNKIRRYTSNDNIDIICCLANEYAIPNKVYYKQFVRMSRILAISFRRLVIKSTIQGNSLIVSPEGDIIQTAYNTNEILKGTVILKSVNTYYERLGYKVVISFWSILIFLFILKERLCIK
jgi:apolipoprotein N-acyltransferase